MRASLKITKQVAKCQDDLTLKIDKAKDKLALKFF